MACLFHLRQRIVGQGSGMIPLDEIGMDPRVPIKRYMALLYKQYVHIQCEPRWVFEVWIPPMTVSLREKYWGRIENLETEAVEYWLQRGETNLAAIYCRVQREDAVYAFSKFLEFYRQQEAMMLGTKEYL